jgi:predicted AlkP superfamily phosphohydrolase/phosphomutase/tetratricopeptide (TPR) repeat protein
MPRKLLLIGWDAADWKAINPLLEAGKMPNLNRLINGGVMGNLATLDPPLSPMLWTSISTGKRPYKHGIHGFTEVDPNARAVRPVHITSRKGKAIWNILTQKGYKTHQVGWWPSHPAEPINGIAISNFYQKAHKPISEPWEMAEGTVHPKEKAAFFQELRIHPHELTAAHLLPFIPKGAELDQSDSANQKRLNALRSTLAEGASIHAAATYILEEEDWDFTAVYLDSIDHFCHAFMKFNPPRREHIPEKEYEMFKGVVEAGYRFHDMMLGRLMELAGEDTYIMLISDHGFHPDHRRPKGIPIEPAGPAVEHSPYGIIVMKGPGIKKDERLYGASLLDITPTILTLFDLPVGQDMDGKVLLDAFSEPKQIELIPSWDEVPGEAGLHKKAVEEDSAAAQAALQQLIDLGYVEAPGENAEKAIERITLENRFYLARAYMNGHHHLEASRILKELFDEKPESTRYGTYLAQCYLQTREIKKARETVQKLREQSNQESSGLWLLQGLVVLSENKPRKALTYFQKAAQIAPDNPGIHQQIGRCMGMLGKWEESKKAYRKVISLDDENENGYHGLGLASLRLRQYEEAIEHLMESIGLIYHQPLAHYHLAEALTQLGYHEQAAEALRVCLHMRPGLNKARNELIRLYENQLNLPEQAETLRQEVLDHTKKEIIIVSGLPRSGTSMMMNMLQAGGIPAFTDKQRKADDSNQKGYFEHEAVKALARDQRFLEDIDGQAVKVIAQLLFHLPDRYRYKVIFMERDLDEIINSQHRMLVRMGKAKEDLFPFSMASGFQQALEKVKKEFAQKSNVDLLFVPYKEVIESPEKQAKKVADFLNIALNIGKMAAVRDMALYRVRK